MASDTSPSTFADARTRLDEIVTEVRKKTLSLEKSLDLYEEAIELGNRCAELVDKADFTAEEALAASEVLDSPAPELTLSGTQGGGGAHVEEGASPEAATSDAQ